MNNDTTTQAAYQKAIERARERGGADIVTPLSDSRYSVLASNGRDFYTVEVVEKARQEVFVCNCQAGRHALLCAHKACTFLYRTREAMRLASRPERAARVTAARAAIWPEAY